MRMILEDKVLTGRRAAVYPLQSNEFNDILSEFRLQLQLFCYQSTLEYHLYILREHAQS